ncbi:MAG: ATP-binding protein [bacterium]
MNYIKRDLEDVVTSLTGEYPAIIVTGPRQVGKTTMLQKLMSGTDRKYVTLDDLTERKLAKNDPEMFFQLHKPPILINEVQYAPELFPYIKIMADRHKNAGDFWLTGSQAFRLMDIAGESLAGRAAILHMSSLSQKEIYGSGENQPFTLSIEALQKRQLNRTPADTPVIYERIYKGSMPALASGQYSNSNIFYSSYLQTYIERDVKELSGAINSIKFMDFITAAACRCSQMVNAADIAKDLDVHPDTVKNWLGILEKSDIIFYLRPYSNNLLKRTVKTPKLYFYDTGLAAYLTKWSSAETLQNGAMSGAILENYAVSEIMKSYYNSAAEPFFYYYRDKDAKEIDLVLEADGVINPIEIKKTAAPETRLFSLFKLLDKGSVPRGKGAVLCMKSELSAQDKQNFIVPIWMI